MSILVLTLLCGYVHYNALGLYIKLFALYKNIFFMSKSSQVKISLFQQELYVRNNNLQKQYMPSV